MRRGPTTAGADGNQRRRQRPWPAAGPRGPPAAADSGGGAAAGRRQGPAAAGASGGREPAPGADGVKMQTCSLVDLAGDHPQLRRVRLMRVAAIAMLSCFSRTFRENSDSRSVVTVSDHDASHGEKLSPGYSRRGLPLSRQVEKGRALWSKTHGRPSARFSERDAAGALVEMKTFVGMKSLSFSSSRRRTSRRCSRSISKRPCKMCVRHLTKSS